MIIFPKTQSAHLVSQTTGRMPQNTKEDYRKRNWWDCINTHW